MTEEMKSVNQIIIDTNNIYSKSYWWAERYDYLESLSDSEMWNIRDYLISRGKDLSGAWMENKGFCDSIIQKRRHNKVKEILSGRNNYLHHFIN